MKGSSDSMEAVAVDDPAHRIEELILAHGTRGMDRLRGSLSPGYCTRAAQMILENRGRVLIGTGFPINGLSETDGPVGAVALYRALETLESDPVLVCASPLSHILEAHYDTYEMPIWPWEESRRAVQSALEAFKPSLLVAVEQPGVAEDGRYYNMNGEDISDSVAKFDLFFELCDCPTIAFGDGGNEIGMGNVYEALASLPVVPSVTRCDELVIATVSNWGVYGVIAAMSRLMGLDLLGNVDPESAMVYLVANGCVDGVTSRAVHTEDGLPLAIGMSVIEQLRKTLRGGLVNV
jgi:hypothetical protein